VMCIFLFTREKDEKSLGVGRREAIIPRTSHGRVFI
jgi:hypothetical protein